MLYESLEGWKNDNNLERSQIPHPQTLLTVGKQPFALFICAEDDCDWKLRRGSFENPQHMFLAEKWEKWFLITHSYLKKMCIFSFNRLKATSYCIVQFSGLILCFYFFASHGVCLISGLALVDLTWPRSAPIFTCPSFIAKFYVQ